MNCQQARPLIAPYVDGELDAAGVLALEKHVHECPACALVWRNAQTLKKSLQQDALFFPAPAELRRRLKAELPSPRAARPRWSFGSWNWLTAATSSVAVACLALALTVTLNLPTAEQRLAREIVASHVRSLMASHALDVVSTDQHTVKPWFNGKLDFSPPVKNLAALDFPLIGGRLDYLAGRSVSALVFQRQKHIINLFIWPASENHPQPMPLKAVQGYQVIHWSDAGMAFWAVSDLNEKELMTFVRSYAAADPLK